MKVFIILDPDLYMARAAARQVRVDQLQERYGQDAARYNEKQEEVSINAQDC